MFQASSIYIGGNPKLGSISGFNSLAQVPVVSAEADLQLNKMMPSLISQDLMPL